MNEKRISTAELDRLFDEGHDITKYLDLSKAKRPGRDPKRVNVDFPQWMVYRLDWEARRLGITRQAVIKTWIGDRIKKEDAHRGAPQETPDK
jgi:hypothetical protein